MSLGKGVLPPSDKSPEMFIGWAKAPAVDRRFLFAALPIALATTTGLGYALASFQDDPGAGAWRTGAVHSETGLIVSKPYPMLRVADERAPYGMRTVLVVAQGKCTRALNLAGAEGAAATASGVLIERGSRRMLEAPIELGDWLTEIEETPAIAALRTPPIESLGRARLAGQIMDSKCFFGVMRPSWGKTHKACASLCIRGGIPPSFWARGADGRESVLLLTDANGDPSGEAILPFVADPLEAEGEIVRVGDLLQFRADAIAFRRL